MSRQYLRGRVRGRQVAMLGYYDDSLDEAGRAAKLEAAAASYDGDALEGFWRGAREIRPDKLQRNVRARAQSGHITADDKDARAERQINQLRKANSRGTYWLVAVLAVVFGLLLTLSTLVSSWRPTHLIVYLLGAGFIALNSWWLPRRGIAAALAYDDVLATPSREGVRAAAKQNALWTLALIVCFFGGLAVLGVAVAALR